MHSQMRKESWVEHRDHSALSFGISIILVYFQKCRDRECKDTRVCLWEPEWKILSHWKGEMHHFLSINAICGLVL